MKRTVLFVGLFVFTFNVMAQTDYLQWEIINIKPKADKLDLFKKGVAAHNKKFHAAAPYKVSFSLSITGPNSGQYTSIMGPATWTQLDSRPGKGEHETDWDKNVVPYVESFGEVSYWRMDKDIQYRPANANPASFNKGRLRFFTILPGQGDRFADAIKKIAEVYKKKEYTASYVAYWKYGASAGPHVAVSLDFDKWAYLDKANTLVKDFDEIHGANSWNRFLEEVELCIDRTKTFDELTETVAELGSN